MIQALLRIVIPAEKREETLGVLQCLQEPTKVCSGCRGSWVLENPLCAGSLTYLVQWESQEQLDEHLRSERFRRLLPYIEMSVEVPQFEVSSGDVLGEIGYLVGTLEVDAP